MDRKEKEDKVMKKQTDDGFARSIVNLLQQEGLLSTEEKIKLLTKLRGTEG